MTSPLLDIDRVSKRFGQVVIAEDLSLAVGPGDIVGIVGPNGAGKTSLFGLISGDLAPDAGELRFGGRTVTRLDPAGRCKLGIGRTYQVPRPFGDMTVFENLLVAAQQGGGKRGRASYAAAVEALERAGITGQANVPAERLGLLQRKRLELARALATQPALLLLDEVAGGLTDPEVAQLVEIVRDVNATGTAVIWIEHVVRALTAVVQPADLPGRRHVHRRRRPRHRAGQPRGPRGLPRHRHHRRAGRPRRAGRAAPPGRGHAGGRRQAERAVNAPTDGARPENGTPLLEVRDLVVHHGQLRALDGISFRVFPGEVYAIIGANGPANRRCCARSPGCTSRRRARCCSTART